MACGQTATLTQQKQATLHRILEIHTKQMESGFSLIHMRFRHIDRKIFLSSLLLVH